MLILFGLWWNLSVVLIALLLWPKMLNSFTRIYWPSLLLQRSAYSCYLASMVGPKFFEFFMYILLINTLYWYSCIGSKNVQYSVDCNFTLLFPLLCRCFTNLIWSHLSILSTISCAIGIHLRKILPPSVSLKVLSTVLFKRPRFSVLTFRYLIHFDFSLINSEKRRCRCFACG